MYVSLKLKLNGNLPNTVLALPMAWLATESL